MSHSFIDPKKNYYNIDNDSDTPQKKIDPVAQLKWLSTPQVHGGWGLFHNQSVGEQDNQPTQMFAKDEGKPKAEENQKQNQQIQEVQTPKKEEPEIEEKKKAGELTTSDNCVDFIAGFEGCELEIYDDAAGYATIGYGHLIYKGKKGTNKEKEKEFKDGISKEKAKELLKKDIKDKAETFVQTNVTVKLSQNQFDALVSFTFNVGGGSLKSSTLLKNVNAGKDAATITSNFKAWNKAGGKELSGLTKRREKEAEMFNNGTY